MPRKPVSEKEIAVSTPVPARHRPAAPKRVKRTVSAGAPATQPEPDTPSREQIARLAFSYWEARGCQGGSPEEDWLRAEQELTGKRHLTAIA